MSKLVKSLNPENVSDLIWDYDDVDKLIPKEVDDVISHFNSTDYQSLIGDLSPVVSVDTESGIEYVHLRSDRSSKKNVILHFNSFGNGMDENMQLRTLFIYSVMNGFNLTADDKSIPILSLAAPTAKHVVKTSRKQRKKISQGNFKQLAEKYLELVKGLGYQELMIIGFSGGATVATAVAVAGIENGFKVSHVGIGEPANVRRRAPLTLSRDFLHAFRDLDRAIDDGGIEHFKRFYLKQNGRTFTKNLIKNSRTNISLVRGLSRDGFKTDLETLVNSQVKVTVGWGGLNRLCPPDVIKGIVGDKRSLSNGKSIHTIEVNNIGHVWADRLNLLATFYAYALSR